MENKLGRLQRLVGPKMVVSFENDEFVLKPSQVRISFDMTENDFKLSDKKLVEDILDPMIRNLLGCLDVERPYSENAHQKFMNMATRIITAIPK